MCKPRGDLNLKLTRTRGLLPQRDITEVLTHASNSLVSLKNAKILITGGSGFIGTWLISVLLEANESMKLNLSIVTVSRDPAKALVRLKPRDSDSLSIHQYDLVNGSSLKTLEGIEFTHMIHAATPTVVNTGKTDQANIFRSAVSGAESLVSLATKLINPPVLVHLSSGAVYGPQPLELKSLPEGWNSNNNKLLLAPYAAAKLEAELVVTNAHADGKVKGSNPRLFAFFGPYLPTNAHYAIGNFMRYAMDEGEIIVNGNPLTVRSYLYATDLIISLLAVLVNPTIKPLHIGSSEEITMQNLSSTVSRIHGEIPIMFSNPNQSISRYIPNTKFASEYYQLQQRVSLEEGIRRWAKWLNG